MQATDRALYVVPHILRGPPRTGAPGFEGAVVVYCSVPRAMPAGGHAPDIRVTGKSGRRGITRDRQPLVMDSGKTAVQRGVRRSRQAHRTRSFHDRKRTDNNCRSVNVVHRRTSAVGRAPVR
jgi:hypothetical protein